MKHSAQIHFDQIAHIYDQYKAKNSLYYDILIDGINQQIESKNASILDIGCGTGTILEKLNPARGLGIDISQQMVNHASQKYRLKKRLKFKKHNIEQKPVSGRFDYIIFADVIEHLMNPEKAIRNISITLKMNSKLILTMANPFWEPIMLILEKLNLKMPEGPHYRLSDNQLKNLLEKSNLKIIKKIILLPKISIPYFNNFGLIFIYVIEKK